MICGKVLNVFNKNMLDYFIQFLYFLVALLITFTVHEASHALVAYYLGDPTAKLKGRLTLNPIAHLDPVGSLIFLVTQRIGWGKPVPVNPRSEERRVGKECRSRW